MAHTSFFRAGHFCEGTPVAVVGDEDGVVAETVGSVADGFIDPAFTAAFEEVLFSVYDEAERSAEAGGPIVFTTEFRQDFSVISFRATFGASVVGGNYAGRAVKGVYLQAGVFAEAVMAIVFLYVAGFLSRISGQGRVRFGNFFVAADVLQT